MSQEPNTTNDSSPKPRLRIGLKAPAAGGPATEAPAAPAPPAAPAASVAESAPPPPAAGVAEPSAAPAAPAPATPITTPHLAFKPKKRESETTPAHPVAAAPAAPAEAAPVKLGLKRSGGDTAAPSPASPPATAPTPAETAGPPKGKRPPPGVRIISEEPSAPLDSATPPAAAAPAALAAPVAPMPPISALKPGKAQAQPPPPGPKSAGRGRWPFIAVIVVLVLVVGGESAYILLQKDETFEANQQRPPTVVPTKNPDATTPAGAAPATPPAQPTVVRVDGGGPATGAAAYLESLSSVSVATGGTPRIFVNGQMYQIGATLNPEFGLKWTAINEGARTLEFTDKNGQRYVKKF